MTKKNGLTYAEAGVDIDAGNELVERIKPAAGKTSRPGVMSGLGGFGGLFDLKAAGFNDPILVSATDGVGTKLRIAIDTGELSTIGEDLVAMCVNDLVCQGAEPLLFLDYLATAHLDVDAATKVIEGIANGCELAGCALLGGETAEMPGMYHGTDFDLAGFAVGAMERGTELPSGVVEGDVLLAFPSMGFHSNGYSLVRRVIDQAGLGWDDPAPWNDDGNDLTVAESLLTPTEIYVKDALWAIRNGGVHGLAHITGGGLTENVPRVLPEGLGAEIDLESFWVFPEFMWMAAEGGISDEEMLRTFNCGIGMVLVVSADLADAIVEGVQDQLEQSIWTIGRVTKGEGVSYTGKFGAKGR